MIPYKGPGPRSLRKLKDIDSSVVAQGGDGLVYNSASSLWAPKGIATATRAESHFYADGTSGDDAKDGLPAATPKKTLQAVFGLVPDIVKHNTCVHLSGIFDEPGDTYFTADVMLGKYLLIDGGSDVSVVADDGGSPWIADIASTTSIGLTTAGWVTDAYAGYYVEILSGVQSGQLVTIQGNDATTLTPFKNFSSSPGVGAQFRIAKAVIARAPTVFKMNYGARALSVKIWGHADNPSASGGSIIANSSGYATTKLGSAAVTSGLELNHSMLQIASGDISNCTSHGIVCDNSRLHLAGAVAGTGNAGAGVYAHSGSVVHIKDGAPPTLTGTVGDLAVSDPAAQESTWAAIDAGTPVAVLAEMTMAKEVA